MIRSAALLLTLVTGFSALVYEVAWQKYLAVLLGSHAEATAIVLGLFLGGLSYGYRLFGNISLKMTAAGTPGRPAAPRLLLVYGVIEVCIGLYAIAFPLLFCAVHAISTALANTPESIAFPIDVLLAALLILPPAMLMGGTIPFLTQALSTSLADATRFHAFVYGFNTVGAFLGAISAGFVLIPALGLAGVVLAMGIVNLAAGVAFWGLARRIRGLVVPAPRQHVTTDAEAAPQRGAVLGCIAVAALVGFAMMTLQAVVNRVAALAAGGSPFTFSTVVAVFVLGIAAGSLAVSAMGRISPLVLPMSQWALLACLLLLYPVVADAGYWAHRVRVAFPSRPDLAPAYHFANFIGLQGVLLVPLALSGAALPLLFHRLHDKVGDLGQLAGRLYSWNTVGALLGALLGGYALLFWLDLHHIYRLMLVAICGAATIVTVQALPRHGPVGIGTAVVAVAVIASLPPWPKQRMAAGTFRTREPLPETFAGPDTFFREARIMPDKDWIVFYEDGPTATVAVTNQDGLALFVNGKSDSSLPADQLTVGMLALLPAILVDRCERAFVVGYGTGLTASEFASLDSVREVIVAEISPAVVRAAVNFDPLNGDASRNRKLQIVPRDAYRALLKHSGKFDVIVSEPSNPWVAGVEMLYSLEFLRAARNRLAPGGVFTQWFHTYETDDATLALVLRTTCEAFDHVAIWCGHGRDLLILGFESSDPLPAIDVLQRRWGRRDFQEGFGRIGVESLPALLAHEILPLGVLHEIDLPGAIHTLLRPSLNHRAALAFFAGASASLPACTTHRAAEIGAANSLLGRYHAARGGSLSDTDWGGAASEVCKLAQSACATFLARWAHERSESPQLAEFLAGLRQGSNEVPMLSPSHLSRLSSLFSADGTSGDDATYDVALGVTEVFEHFYHHAFPFDAAALRNLWQRCDGDPRCEAGRARAMATGVDRSRR